MQEEFEEVAGAGLCNKFLFPTPGPDSMGNQVIVYPRQLRENFLVHHSSLGSLGEMRRPSGFSIGGTCWQWRSRGGRKQEQEDPEIVFPIIVIFVCFKVKVGAI